MTSVESKAALRPRGSTNAERKQKETLVRGASGIVIDTEVDFLFAVGFVRVHIKKTAVCLFTLLFVTETAEFDT